MKIKNRIAAATGACLVVSAVILLIAVAWNYRSVEAKTVAIVNQELGDKAKVYLAALAEAEANKTALELNRALYVAKGISDTTDSIITQQGENTSRDMFYEYLKRVMELNRNITGATMAWLKNAVDGRDADSLGQIHAHTNGQFAAYWFRTGDGSLGYRPANLKAVEDALAKQDNSATWYTCPVDTKKTCMMEPYSWQAGGRTIVGTSIMLPILINNQVKGITGVDIELSFLTELVKKVDQSLYNGKGQVLLVSHSGLVAADSDDLQDLGKMYQGEQKATILERIKVGNSGVLQMGGRFWAIQPVRLKGVDTPWAVVISIEESTVLAGVIQAQQSMEEQFNSSIVTSTLIGLSVAGLGIILLTFIAHGIAAPIRRTSNMINQLASKDGDLTQRLQLNRPDEVGDLARGIDTFIAKTHNIVKDIAVEMSSVEDSASRVSQVSDNSSKSIKTQRNEVDLVVAAINQMASSAGEVAKIATTTANASSEARASVDSSALNVNKSAKSIRLLSEQISTTSSVMDQLAQDSQNISKIVESIQGISEQTNLLALNAAIEAARAGESGRGFAVVADEVRNLASLTQQSTEEIQGLIHQLQSRSETAVDAMKQGNSQSSECLELADEASKHLEQVVTAIAEIDNSTNQMACIVEEQKTVTEDLTRNISNISDETNQVANGTTEVNRESQALLDLVKKLEGQLGRFRY